MIRKQLILPLLKEICVEEGINFIEEPTRGMYAVLIFENGKNFYLKDINLNLNPVSSVRITKNKALTSFFLNQFGYNNPEYTMVYSREKCKKHNLQDTLKKGKIFAERIGYPVILKKNDSSKGNGVFKVFNQNEFDNAANIIFENSDTFQVQKFYAYNDYRVVVLGNKIISAYQRVPLSVCGDGTSTILQLLENKQNYFDRIGRDTIIDFYNEDTQSILKNEGMSMNTILPKGQTFILRSVSNLSAGGESLDVTNTIHNEYRDLCVNIARDLNLSLCGIDIMCTNIVGPVSDYIILEVNSAPGLDNYLYSGCKQNEYVKNLYREVIMFIVKTYGT